MKTMNKIKTTEEPPAEVIKSMQQKCWEEMKIKLPKKDVIAALEKTKEAEEADKLLKRRWIHGQVYRKKKLKILEKSMNRITELRKNFLITK